MATRGRLGARLGPGRQLLLVTVGRKSGEPRPVALTYLEDGGRWIVVASNAGDDRDPTWRLNLAAQPRAEVVIAGRKVPIVAREVPDPEREGLYQRFIDDIDPSYAEYQTRTSRRIPVIALEPA